MRIQGVAAEMYMREDDLIRLLRCLYLRTPNLLLVLLPVSQAATAVSVIFVILPGAEHSEACSSGNIGGLIPKILVPLIFRTLELLK